MSNNFLKYDFRFNRLEAEVMLEVLEHWIKNFTSGLESPFDWKDRSEKEAGLFITEKLIKQITRQVNTKKKVLNFIIVDYTRFNLSSSLKVNKYEKELAKIDDPIEIKNLQEKIEICRVLAKRIMELSYVGEPAIITQMRKEANGDFNQN